MGTGTEILINRVVDGIATEADWADVEREGAADPALWREIVLTQRDARGIAACVGHASCGADRVEMHGLRIAGTNAAPRPANAWFGWAAAAAVALSWAGVGLNRGESPRDIGSNAASVPGLGLAGSASELFQKYVARGREEGSVVGEMPDGVVVEARPAPDGRGYEVYFIRGAIERAYMPNLEFYRPGYDELGRVHPSSTPIHRAVFDPM